MNEDCKQLEGINLTAVMVDVDKIEFRIDDKVVAEWVDDCLVQDDVWHSLEINDVTYDLNYSFDQESMSSPSITIYGLWENSDGDFETNYEDTFNVNVIIDDKLLNRIKTLVNEIDNIIDTIDDKSYAHEHKFDLAIKQITTKILPKSFIDSFSYNQYNKIKETIVE